MITPDSHRLVAHIDILGMSTLIRRDLASAWGVLSDLVNVRDDAREFEYEFLDKNERLKVSEIVKMVTFSDTLLAFTKGDSDIEVKSMLILVSHIFHQALCKCVPIRAGIAVGEFWVNFDKSMYCGPAMLEAYEIGEASQWLGIVLSKAMGERAKAQKMTSGKHPFIVDWNVPLKSGTCLMPVVNWPRFVANDLRVQPPLSVEQFYEAFKGDFGGIEGLPKASAIKHKNTVEFFNEMLSP